MRPNLQERVTRNLITIVILLFFATYGAIVYFKTSITLGNNEIMFSSIGADFACNSECMDIVNIFIYNEVFAHLRTASVSLLIGFVVGVNLLGTAAGARRRFGIAMAICGAAVVNCAFLGEAQMGVRVLLIAIGVLGLVNAWRCIRTQA